MEEKLICAWLLGKAQTVEKAKRLAEKYRNCPYVNFIATREEQLFITFFLPEGQRWWVETIREKPSETIGLETAEVIIMNETHYPEKLRMRLPRKPQDVSPCGSKCENCLLYLKCSGCPATIFFRESKT
ncbi:MAG: hypothetical protein OEZ29_01445 [Candidatus Bathyarchaeota archaeon]|nr:hypothetical protein [Candidatus Bathyarchaeota archaeon]MDH5779241.1 hypothetical protein [Candidatus Bathyarchaeota archaeon]